MERVFSGIQPSGNLTIANYAGAIRNWVKLQAKADCVFCLVDLHTITVPRDPALLRSRCYDFLALYMACGIDPEKSIVFLQSHNPNHAELTWILSCFTPFGALGRMTQFKDKSRNKNVCAGLYLYPVLMAADILLYDTDLVPVGDDQVQHVELTRDIAMRVNQRLGDLFVVPRAEVPQVGARIRNLLDPSRKMDKSSDNPKTYIGLLDPPDVVGAKLRSATTSTDPTYRSDDASGTANLVSIMSVVTGEPPRRVADRYEGVGFAAFKTDLAEATNEFLRPIQSRYRELRAAEATLDAVFHHGAVRARRISARKLGEVADRVGLPVPRIGYSGGDT